MFEVYVWEYFLVCVGVSSNMKMQGQKKNSEVVIQIKEFMPERKWHKPSVNEKQVSY